MIVKFSGEQRGVATGALAALAVTVLALLAGYSGLLAAPLGDSLPQRAHLWASSSLLALLPLLFSIARLANHRFATPDDIAGAGLTSGTDRARLLQALLQNTLEQTVLAIAVYAAWSFLAPAGWGALPAIACILFIVGRTAFLAGYAKGAGGRAFGFGLTFYPTVLMILVMLPAAANMLWHQIAG